MQFHPTDITGNSGRSELRRMYNGNPPTAKKNQINYKLYTSIQETLKFKGYLRSAWIRRRTTTTYYFRGINTYDSTIRKPWNPECACKCTKTSIATETECHLNPNQQVKPNGCQLFKMIYKLHHQGNDSNSNLRKL